jgi:hypothetical protein
MNQSIFVESFLIKKAHFIIIPSLSCIVPSGTPPIASNNRISFDSIIETFWSIPFYSIVDKTRKAENHFSHRPHPPTQRTPKGLSMYVSSCHPKWIPPTSIAPQQPGFSPQSGGTHNDSSNENGLIHVRCAVQEGPSLFTAGTATATWWAMSSCIQFYFIEL